MRFLESECTGWPRPSLGDSSNAWLDAGFPKEQERRTPARNSQFDTTDDKRKEAEAAAGGRDPEGMERRNSS